MIVQLITLTIAVLSVVNSQQPQAATYQQGVNGLQYSQQGINPGLGNLFSTHQQALAYSNQQAYPQPGAAYSNQQAYPQPGAVFSNQQAYPQPGAVFSNQQTYPQPGAALNNQPYSPLYNGHFATQQALPQGVTVGNQQQPFPSVAQASPALPPARVAPQTQGAASSKTPTGASLLGVSFSSTADASQVRFSGPGVSFSY